MIKRIIFDVDNTLILWKDIYDYNAITNSLKQVDLPNDNNTYEKVSKAIQRYDDICIYHNKEEISKYLKKETNLNLDTNFINIWLSNIKKYGVPEKIEEETVEILEYLSKKYELVILSNWFEDCQICRLEKCKIYKYFSEIYTSEKYKKKPDKEIFLAAIGNNKPEECVMVGDSITSDIEGAINLGIKAIWFNNKNNKTINNDKCKTINSLIEIKDIL